MLISTEKGLEPIDNLLNRQEIRRKIDVLTPTQSREGILSDTVAVLVYGLAEVVAAIGSATTLEDVKTALAERIPTATALLAGVQSGQIKLPYLAAKSGGVQAVVSDFVGLSNGISDVLIEHAAPASSAAPTSGSAG